MKNLVEIFALLGERLVGFGNDPLTQEVIARACSENGWFQPAEIARAVETIRKDMLRRGKLERWLKSYPLPVALPRRVLVIMAGNIPLVGFFDLLCVVASGHRCLVKPSGKDRVLMEHVIGLLKEIEQGIALELFDGTASPEAVIATGSDNARRYFRVRYAAIPALLRGSRQSVAVLSGRESEAQLAGLADDIFAYSGLGCRNVSLLFVPRGAQPLLRVPRMNAKYRNNYRQVRALLEMDGVPFIDLGEAVAVVDTGFSPALSRISYVYYDDLKQVEAWLAAHDPVLQCVVSECIDHPRRIPFGKAQSPALTDYPDAVDVLHFLSELR